MPRIYADVAARLRRARSSQGLPLEEVASRAGITSSFLGQIERGERKPSLRTAILIARALGVPAGAVFEDGAAAGPKARLDERVLGLLAGWPEERLRLALDTLAFLSRRLRREGAKRRR